MKVNLKFNYKGQSTLKKKSTPEWSINKIIFLFAPNFYPYRIFKCCNSVKHEKAVSVVIKSKRQSFLK